MRDVWNHLVTTEAWETVAEYLRMIGQRNPVQILEHLKARNLPPALGRELEENLTWPAWNLVQGPTLRYDDPKDKAEEFHIDAMDIVSQRTEAPYLINTEVLGEQMTAFLNALQRISADGHIEALHVKRAAARQAAGLPPPVPVSSVERESKTKKPKYKKVIDMNALVDTLQMKMYFHGWILRAVTMPLFYQEQMWVYRAGQYAISGSKKSITGKLLDLPKPGESKPVIEFKSNMTKMTCDTAGCGKSYLSVKAGAAPSFRGDMKNIFCHTCKEMRLFVGR